MNLDKRRITRTYRFSLHLVEPHAASNLDTKERKKAADADMARVEAKGKAILSPDQVDLVRDILQTV